MPTGADPGVRGDRQAVAVILPLLKHPQGDLREKAVEALAALEDPAGLEAAAALVEDAEVWQAALQAAWKLPSAQLYQRLAPLCEHLSDSKSAQRERAEGVLAQFQAEVRNVRLWGPPQAESPEDAAAKRSWDPRWAKLLAKHLDGANRAGVATALGVVQGNKAVPQLLRVLPAAAKRGESDVIETLAWLRAGKPSSP